MSDRGSGVHRAITRTDEPRASMSGSVPCDRKGAHVCPICGMREETPAAAEACCAALAGAPIRKRREFKRRD